MAGRRRQRSGRVSDVLLAVIWMLFIFSLSVVLVLNFRWLYYMDITVLGLEKRSGMDAASIKANYDALIRYNQFWFRGELNFPTLAMSATGRIHFAEVKRIFAAIQYLCMGSFVCVLVGVFRKRRKRQYGYLTLSGILTLAVPVILGALAAVNWDQFFITFHRIFFRNNYWLFDPKTDPVILILPDDYFLHCAIGILIFILIGSLLCFWAAGRHRRAGRGYRGRERGVRARN